MDDDVAADNPSAARPRRRFHVVLVTACLVTVAALVGVFIVRDNPRAAIPAGPPGALLITGTGMLVQAPGKEITLCVGAVLQSLPPQCGDAVPVTGITWAQVPGAMTESGVFTANVTVTGWWADGVLQVVKVSAPAHEESPRPHLPGPLCSNPQGVQTTGAPDQAPSEELFRTIPGYQGMWVTYPGGAPTTGTTPTQMVYNVAVLSDVATAAAEIRKSFPGLLCVGTLPGLPLQTILDASRQLEDHVKDLKLLTYGPSLLGNKSTLDVEVFLATDDTVAAIHAIVGPEVAEFTTVTGQFHVVR